jgi:hypothetical protein
MKGKINYQCTADFESPIYYYFFRRQNIYGGFLGIFRGALYLFDPKIALRYAQNNLGVKEVPAPSKNPSKFPSM